jgi:hypothetical protein
MSLQNFFCNGRGFSFLEARSFAVPGRLGTPCARRRQTISGIQRQIYYSRRFGFMSHKTCGHGLRGARRLLDPVKRHNVVLHESHSEWLNSAGMEVRCSGTSYRLAEIERARTEIAKLEEERDEALKTGASQPKKTIRLPVGSPLMSFSLVIT